MGRPIDRSGWPQPGPHRRLLELLDRLHRENGQRSLAEVAKRMNLSAASRVSVLLRGHKLPVDDGQLRRLVKALGGGTDEQARAIKLFSEITSTPARKPGSARPRDSSADSGRLAALTARTHRAAFPIPYIRRDVESEIFGCLQEGRPVVLVGSSMVGKTRIAAAVIAESFADRPLHIPETRNSLRELAHSESVPHGSVVVLDDIDRLIGAGGISQSALLRLTGSNILLATIRSHLYDAYLPTSGLRAPEWDVLAQFEPVFVGSELSAAEQLRLLKAVDDETQRECILHTGIGEYVGAAETISNALRGAPSHQPLAMALILGAVDWARAGLRDPIPAEVLTKLATPYASERHVDMLSTLGGDYEKALRWATHEINPKVSLLTPARNNSFVINDYALDLLTRSASAVPETTWPILLDLAGPVELIDIACSAGASSHPHITEQALRLCEQHGDPDTAPIAAMLLGPRLRERRDAAGAELAYRRAIGSGHADAAPMAWYNLGNLLWSEGRTAEALAANRQAITASHPWASPQALLALGTRLEGSGDDAGAEKAYRDAIDWDIDFAKIKQDVEDGARAQGKKVVVALLDLRRRRADPEVIAIALLRLGHLLRDRGEIDEARRAYERAAGLERGEAADEAHMALGNLLLDQDQLQGARNAFERAARSNDPHIASKAQCTLGQVLFKQHEMQQAETALRSSLASRHSDASVVAGVYLALVLLRSKRLDEMQDTLIHVATLADNEPGRAALRTLQSFADGPGLNPLLADIARSVALVMEAAA